MSTEDQSAGPSDADRLIRRMGAVPEATMRVALWRETFERGEPQPLLALVQAVLAGVTRRSEDHRLAYMALLTFLESLRGQGSEGRRALYEAAHLAEDEGVMRLLRTAPPAREAHPKELQVPQLDPDREVTLGERRMLARKPDRDVLVRLLADPDTGVITNLLRNPRLTEADVLRIASKRPIGADILGVVFRHPRWGRVAEVQKALVYNPYTPVDMALGLVSLLPLAEIRQISGDPQVPHVVRVRAKAQVEGREALSVAIVEPVAALTHEEATDESLTQGPSRSPADEPDED